MVEVLAGENQAVVVVGLLETYFALVRTISPDFYFFSKVDEHKCRKYFSEYFLEQILASQKRIGDPNEYEVETAQVEHKLIKKDRFVAPVAYKLYDVHSWYAPDSQKHQNQQCGLLIDIETYTQCGLE